MCVWAPGNGLGAEGAAALAEPLGKLVHLASLDLYGTWRGRGVCRMCVCMPCRVGVCVGGCGSAGLRG